MTFASETISSPVKVYFPKKPMFDLVKLGNKRPQMKIQCFIQNFQIKTVSNNSNLHKFDFYF